MAERKSPPPPARKPTTKAAKPKPRAPKIEPRPVSTGGGGLGPMRLTAYVALAIILVDQALKYWVVHVMRLDRVREIDVLPPWLNLRMAWNEGINFGLLSNQADFMRWLLIAVGVVISIWLWVWLVRSKAGMIARIAGGLLIGGALGNVIDRIYYGAVADFLNMSLPGWQNPYSFNLADIAIFAGAIGLILMPGREPDDKGDDKTRDEPRKSR